eukprot:TRINITY_DN1939_c0_g1_i6.p1 TRINITY_DN1939_c0_g1~~TRINITY_DN1939_c0_g1_i6.p1  ORF type:complete len:258 (-),score=68.60 TRINITY_DN1939_c0_g1_i6:61-834(-)
MPSLVGSEMCIRDRYMGILENKKGKMYGGEVHNVALGPIDKLPEQNLNLSFNTYARKTLRPADGAHLFFCLIFLVATSIVKLNYIVDCNSESSFFDLLFYGLVAWSTYLLITLVPNYKNPALQKFFTILDIIYALMHFGLFIWGWRLRSSHLAYCGVSDNILVKSVPQFFLLELYLWFGLVIFILLVLGLVAWVVRRAAKPKKGLNETEMADQHMLAQIYAAYFQMNMDFKQQISNGTRNVFITYVHAIQRLSLIHI